MPARKQNKFSVDGIMSYASSSMLKFAGSLLVLSLAVNNIKQLDKIADAYAEVVVIQAKAMYEPQQCEAPAMDVMLLEERLKALEEKSHDPG